MKHSSKSTRRWIDSGDLSFGSRSITHRVCSHFQQPPGDRRRRILPAGLVTAKGLENNNFRAQMPDKLDRKLIKTRPKRGETRT